MISKILNNFRGIKENFGLINQKTSSIKEITEDAFCLSILLKMFEQNFFISYTSWSISAKEVLLICNDIVINERKSILEFGSGFSTICIAQLIKINKLDVIFYSVEDKLSWIEKLSGELEKLGLRKYVRFIHAPVRNIEKSNLLYKNQQKWYDVDILSSTLKEVMLDCIIVDGPPGYNTPFSRYSALPFLKEYLNPKFSLFLDDYRREQEREILNEWSKFLTFKVFDFTRYAYITDEQVFETEPLTPHLF